jgi:hypothetical protein
MSKLSIALELAGVEQARKQLADLDKLAASTTGAKSVNLESWLKATQGNVSDAFRKLNPDFAKAISTATNQGMSEGIKKAAATIPGAFAGQQQNAHVLAYQSNRSARANTIAGLLRLLSPGGMSSYMGSTQLARGLFGGVGAGGGGGGLFAAAGAGGPEVALAAAALYAAFKLLKVVTEELIDIFKEGIQSGAKLFQEAASVGRSPVQLGQLQQTLQAVGISSEVSRMLLLYGQFGGPGGRMRGIDAVQGMRLGAQRAGQMGDLQQINNLSRYIAYAWDQTAAAARQSAGVAKTLFITSMVGSLLKTQWDTMKEQLSAIFAPLIGGALAQAVWLMKGFNAELEAIVVILQRLHLLPKGTTDNTQMHPMNWRPAFNQFQRMGFVFGGGAAIGGDYAAQTARNTGQTNVLLMQMLKFSSPGSHIVRINNNTD